MVLRVLLRAGLAVAIAAGPAAGIAAADAAQRSAWWNTVSGPGVAAPQPTTADGDLHVAQGPGAPLAFAAVMYAGSDAPSVRLVLTLRDDRLFGTPLVVACPTTTVDWEDGGNQPAGAAPDYDCASPAQGALSEDGTTMSFALDERHQLAPGTWSIALVPQPSAQAPFSVDFVQPDQKVFDPAPRGSDRPVGVADDPRGETPPPPAFDIPSSEAFPGGGPAPPAETRPAQTPEISDPTAVPTAATPAAGSASSAARHVTSGERLLALLTLFAGTALVGHSMQQERHAPHLLGGRARTPTVPLPDAGLHPARHERPRGVGRFARVRTEPPRRLR
jgi:hypothetical protein